MIPALPNIARLTAPVLLAAASGCAAARFVPPETPPVPAPEAPAAWAEATRVCRDASTVRASLRLSARAGERRIPRVRVGLAIGDDGRALALQAPSVFTLRGTAARATLVLHDGRYVQAPVAEIVEALIDVELDPSRLLAILTGCAAPQPDFVEAERRGAWLVVTSNETRAYLQQAGGTGWRVRAAEFQDLLVDYSDLGPEYPRRVVVRSRDETGPAPVSITIDDLEIFPVTEPLSPSLFETMLPAGAAAISLDELTRALGGADRE